MLATVERKEGGRRAKRNGDGGAGRAKRGYEADWDTDSRLGPIVG